MSFGVAALASCPARRVESAVADLNVYGAVFYLRFALEALAGKPAIAAWMEACRTRPAARKAFALRGE